MTARISILGSGSAGNATLLETGPAAVLIDCGFNQRELANRLLAVGSGWNKVKAVVLTHTHGDHWNKFALLHLRQLGVPLYLHPAHHHHLSACDAYAPLRAAGLLRDYAPGVPFEIGATTAVAQQVCHDSEPTMAFRFDGPGWAYGHASDLGCVSEHLIDLFHGVDAVGLEFNHDVPMQNKSRRPRFLIDRVLSDDGHLCNEQAAEALAAILDSQGERGLRAVFQLHLSRECNTADLARRAAAPVLERASPTTRLITSEQARPTAAVELGGPAPKRAAAMASAAGPF